MDLITPSFRAQRYPRYSWKLYTDYKKKDKKLTGHNKEPIYLEGAEDTRSKEDQMGRGTLEDTPVTSGLELSFEGNVVSPANELVEELRQISIQRRRDNRAEK